MRNEFSSRDEAVAQVNRWWQARARIKILFSSGGLQFGITGFALFSEHENKVWLVTGSDPPEPLAIFPVLGNSFQRIEPLLDLPEEWRWKVGFFIGLSFPLPCGDVTLYEVAE